MLDIHEEIYLVARIEKCLNGDTIHSSVQPYLISMAASESNKLKTAAKLNKKLRQLFKSKLSSYRMPFAWAAKPIYKKVSNSSTTANNKQPIIYELDNESEFSIYEQDGQHLTDDDLYKYLSDFKLKEKLLYKQIQIDGKLSANLIDIDPDLSKEARNLSKSILVNSSTLKKRSLNLAKPLDSSNPNDYVLEMDHFEPHLTLMNQSSASSSSNESSSADQLRSSAKKEINEIKEIKEIPSSHQFITNNTNNNTKLVSAANSSSTTTSNSVTSNSTAFSKLSTSEQYQLIKRARLLRANDEYKSFVYIYPKQLKYDAQKCFARARNIMIRVECRDSDSLVADPTTEADLKCFVNLGADLASLNSSSNNALFSTSYSTPITHHNKCPQFYDEIKCLLPLNLTEKHHLLFKFYHVSCTNARLTSRANSGGEQLLDTSTSNLTLSSTLNKHQPAPIETLVGYAWLPLFKSGRLVCGERHLPIAQNLCSGYLSFESIGFGHSVGPSGIKWVENMRALFKVNLVAQSTVHTTDPHVANFFYQCEKLLNTTTKMTSTRSLNDLSNEEMMSPLSNGNNNKRKAPLAPSSANTALKHPDHHHQRHHSTNTDSQQTMDDDEDDLKEITIVINDSNKEVIKNTIKVSSTNQKSL